MAPLDIMSIIGVLDHGGPAPELGVSTKRLLTNDDCRVLACGARLHVVGELLLDSPAAIGSHVGPVRVDHCARSDDEPPSASWCPIPAQHAHTGSLT